MFSDCPKRNDKYSVCVFLFHKMQIVCDADLRILDVVAKFPGSTHDAFVFQNSSLGVVLGSGLTDEFWILGDSG